MKFWHCTEKEKPSYASIPDKQNYLAIPITARDPYWVIHPPAQSSSEKWLIPAIITGTTQPNAVNSQNCYLKDKAAAAALNSLGKVCYQMIGRYHHQPPAVNLLVS